VFGDNKGEVDVTTWLPGFEVDKPCAIRIEVLGTD
jgi:hypothetical protein